MHQIRRIATFLGRTYSNKFYQDIADACQIDRMRTKKAESVPDDIKVITAAGYDIFYRKGSWHFTIFTNVRLVQSVRGSAYESQSCGLDSYCWQEFFILYSFAFYALLAGRLHICNYKYHKALSIEKIVS